MYLGRNTLNIVLLGRQSVNVQEEKNMFRLKEQQLHILVWLMIIASVLLFGFLGIERIGMPEEKSTWKGMDDYSDGWICTYETADTEKLERYRKEKNIQDTQEDGKAKSATIVEVVTFPATFRVKEGSSVVMTHKLPELALDTLYATLEIENADITVSVEKDVIYSSKDKEKRLPVRHIVPMLTKYQDRMLTIELSNIETELVEVNAIQAGNYNQLWVSTIKERATTLAVGSLLICASLCMLAVWAMAKNTWQQKRLLLYSATEGFLFGILSLLDTELIPLLTGWNYGVYLLRSCVVLIAIIMHLIIIRCFIYKKKVLGIIDVGILCIGIFYISVIVLQMFALVQFDTIYIMGSVLYGVMVLLFTIVLAITVFDYGRKEGLPIFVGNVALIVTVLMQIVMQVTGRGGNDYMYIQIGFFLYVVYVWVFGLRQIFYIQPVQEGKPYDEQELRKEIMERMNPNLIFASFQTLQALIKKGSSNSVKMIYYISAYFRDNLKALESEDSIIPFVEEMEHIIAYLQLQKTRNQNLNFVIECKEKNFQVPRHSLEPLVENAVKHGIANNNNQGNVVVRSYARADGYAVQIVDDGAGFDMHILKRKNTTLAKKLLLLEKSCEARTEVISRDGKGTVITIVFPMLENDLLDDIIDE